MNEVGLCNNFVAEAKTACMHANQLQELGIVEIGTG